MPSHETHADVSRDLTSVSMTLTHTTERTAIEMYKTKLHSETQSTTSPDRIKLTHYAASESHSLKCTYDVAHLSEVMSE